MKNFLKITILLSAVLLCSCSADLSVSSEASKSDSTFAEENMTLSENSGEFSSDSTAPAYTKLTWNNTDYIMIEGCEPPIPQDIFDAPVPDFLTEEQQNLYKRACALYTSMFGCDTVGINYFPPDSGEAFVNLSESVEIDMLHRYLGTNRYKTWDEFTGAVYSVFTKDFFDQRNTLSDNSNIYMDYIGSLCFADISRGGGYYYNKNFPDEFKLISSSDDKIVFTVTGHYSNMLTYPNESSEDRNKRVAQGYEYTHDFEICMVKTESGWRFDQFYDPAADEGLAQHS